MSPKGRVRLTPAGGILARVEIAAPSCCGDLTVWPLVALDCIVPRDRVDYVPLADAVTAGAAHVSTAPGPSRSVRRATIANRSEFAVLALAGESLLAANPRWRATASTLVAPRASAEIEARSAAFASARRSAIAPVFDQLGFVAALGGAIAGLEIVGRAEVFARTHTTLLAPFARMASAPAWSRPFEVAPLETPEALLDLVMRARSVAAPTPGMGEALRLHGRGIVGRGLVAGDVVHLSARWLGDDGEPLVNFP